MHFKADLTRDARTPEAENTEEVLNEEALNKATPLHKEVAEAQVKVPKVQKLLADQALLNAQHLPNTTIAAR